MDRCVCRDYKSGRSQPLHSASTSLPSVASPATSLWTVTTVEQLIECGADPREVNKEGDKPADVVAEASSEEGQKIKALLREAEGKVNISHDDIAGKWSHCQAHSTRN